MLRIFRRHRWPGVTRDALVAPDLNWYLARWGRCWWLVRFLTCSTLCQLGNPATDGSPSRQAAHQAQKRVFLHFSSTNKLGGTFGEPSFSSFFFRCYPNFVTRSSWRGRGALERVVTAQKLLNQITASTGVNLWIITFWFLHDRIQGMEGKSLMAFQMQGQMVASAETPIAVATFKRLGSSVLPVKKNRSVSNGVFKR